MSTSNNDPLAQALGITPVTQIAPAVVDSTEENQTFAKNQIRSAIQDGQLALGELMQIAASSQHPRAYEVLATLVKTIAESSEKLANIEIKQQELVRKNQSPSTINNNLYVGNASELLKMLKNMKGEDAV